MKKDNQDRCHDCTKAKGLTCKIKKNTSDCAFHETTEQKRIREHVEHKKQKPQTDLFEENKRKTFAYTRLTQQKEYQTQ